MDYLIKGIVIVVIMGAIYGAIRGIDSSVREHYVKPVREMMQKQIDEANTARKSAEDANEGLRRDLVSIDAKVKACNARVDDLLSEQEIATKISSEALTKAKAESLSRKAFIDDLVRRASGPPNKGDLCELAKDADKTLTDLSNDQRLRYKPK